MAWAVSIPVRGRPNLGLLARKWRPIKYGSKRSKVLELSARLDWMDLH